MTLLFSLIAAYTGLLIIVAMCPGNLEIACVGTLAAIAVWWWCHNWASEALDTEDA